MSQSAAKFLLEFQATGDQEIVQKLRDIGSSGQEAATQLQDLQTAGEDIGGSLTDIGSGAEEAAAPLEDMGAAAESAVTPLEDMGVAGEDMVSIFEGAGTATEDFSGALEGMSESTGAVEGGLSETNILMDDFVTKADAGKSSADGVGKSFVGVTGGLVGFAASANTAWQSIDNLIDSQYAVQRANIAAARATEMARKAEEGLDKVIQSATSNTDNIAAARDRLSRSMENIERLQRAGISSGQEYEAAQQELTAAQEGLTSALVQGGVAQDKAEGAVNKAVLSTQRATSAQEKARIASEDWGESIVAVAINIGASFGTMISTVIAGGGKWTAMFGKMKGAIAGLSVASLLGPWGKFAIVIGIAAAVAVLFISQYDKIRPVFEEAAKSITAGIKHIQDFTSALKGAIEVIRPMEEQQKRWDEESKKNAKSTEDMSKKTVTFSDNLQQLMKDLGVDKLSEYTNQLLSGADATKVGATETGKLATKMELLAAGTADNMVATEGISSAIAALPEAIEPSSAAATELQSAMEGMTKGEIEAGRAILTDFVPSVKEMITGTAAAEMGAKALASTSIDLSTRLIATGSAGAGAAVGIKAFASASVDLASTVGKVETAAKDMNMVLTETNYNLKAQIIGLRDTTNQEIATSNAILQVTVALEQSNQKLREARAVRDNVAASTNTLQTAVNNELASLIEEEGAIRASIASLRDFESNQQRVKNAYHEGVKSIDEWNVGLSEAAAEERGAMQRLEDLGFTFDDLPGHIEPTIENLMAYAEATVDSGAASERFKEISISAFQDLTSEATPLIQQLADLISNPPLEDAGKKWAEAWSGIGANVKAALDETTIAFTEQRAALSAAGGEAATAWAISFAANFETGAANAERIADQNAINLLNSYKKNIPEMAGTVDQLINIIKTKGPQATQAILRGLEEGVPLAELIGRDYGEGTVTGIDAGLDGIVGTADDKIIGPMGEIPPKAKEIGLDVAEQFGLGWANVLTGLEKALSQMPGFLKQKAMEGIDAFKGVFTATALPPVAVTVDINPAGKQLQALVKTIYSIKQGKPPVILVDPRQAHSLLVKTQAAINALKQTRIPKITINAQQALSTIENVRRRVNSLPNISRIIVYTNRVPSPPRVNDIHRRIIYTRVVRGAVPRATGFTGEVSRPTLMVVGEQGRERVSVEPISTSMSGMGGTKGGYRGGGRGGSGGGDYVIVKGDVNLDAHKVGVWFARAIAENNV